MGMFMKEHDVHVSSFQDQLNQRFAPTVKGHPGGLNEMIALQKEFDIFKTGRRFGTSLAALHIGASLNPEARRRFQLYLASLRKEKSSVAGKNGDAAVVDAIVRNLAAKKPLPIYFQPHDLTASADGKRVIITDKARPLFYVNQDYLVISLPVDNKAGTPSASKPPAKQAKAKKKKAG